MPKKKKQVKNVMVKPTTNHDKIQIDIFKDMNNEKKINPSKVFDGYKKTTVKKTKSKAVPKGSHRMPDGSIMKDSDMKKKTTKKKTTKSKY